MKIEKNSPVKNERHEKNYFLIIIALGSFSCQKEISSEVSNPNNSTQVDVYVAGYEYIANESPSVAKYWKMEIL